MEAQNKQRNLRISKTLEQYVTQSGEKIRVLPYHNPRVSGNRTGNDKEYLKENDGKLAKLATA